MITIKTLGIGDVLNYIYINTAKYCLCTRVIYVHSKNVMLSADNTGTLTLVNAKTYTC